MVFFFFFLKSVAWFVYGCASIVIVYYELFCIVSTHLQRFRWTSTIDETNDDDILYRANTYNMCSTTYILTYIAALLLLLFCFFSQLLLHIICFVSIANSSTQRLLRKIFIHILINIPNNNKVCSIFTTCMHIIRIENAHAH